jgi:AcrR family transcriptional regulator
MPEDLPPVKRKYDASRRQDTARQNRQRILDAARTRFLRDGYSSTTVADIAADAGVAPQTVTKQFANKPGLIKALFDQALVGDDLPDPLESRPGIVAMHEQPDARAKLRMYADTLATMLARTAPIQLLLRQASADGELAEVWAAIRAGRLAGMTNLAGNLAAGRHLRPGVTVEDARDILWTYSSPDMYELLVMDRDWSAARYADFLADAVIAALL